MLYLLQLVAAVRYEKVADEMMATKAATSHYADESDSRQLGGDPLGVTGPELLDEKDRPLSVHGEEVLVWLAFNP